MCMYTHIYVICIHTYIHTHINTHTRICMYVSMGGVGRAFNICQAQRSGSFPQIDLVIFSWNLSFLQNIA